jgi:hypothetical protein
MHGLKPVPFKTAPDAGKCTLQNFGPSKPFFSWTTVFFIDHELRNPRKNRKIGGSAAGLR